MTDHKPLFENEYVKVFKRDTPDGYPYTVVKARTGLGASIIPMIPGKDGKPSRFLVLSQYRPPMNGVSWEFPAGGVDLGESPKDTAVRELEEETNIKVSDDVVHFLGEFHNAPTILEDKISLYIAILPEDYDETQVIPQAGEILETKWLTLDEILSRSLSRLDYSLSLIGKLALAKHAGFISEPLHF